MSSKVIKDKPTQVSFIKHRVPLVKCLPLLFFYITSVLGSTGYLALIAFQSEESWNRFRLTLYLYLIILVIFLFLFISTRQEKAVFIFSIYSYFIKVPLSILAVFYPITKSLIEGIPMSSDDINFVTTIAYVISQVDNAAIVFISSALIVIYYLDRKYKKLVKKGEL